MKYHYKQVQYEQLDKTEKVTKGKVVLDYGAFKMLCDYILVLESAVYNATNKTFKSIPEEMMELLGEKKVKQYYGQYLQCGDSKIYRVPRSVMVAGSTTIILLIIFHFSIDKSILLWYNISTKRKGVNQ